MTQDLEPYTGHFPPQTVQLALRVLAEAGGNARIAHERLSTEFADERLPSFRTLRDWKDNQYPARYRSIVNENDQPLEDIVKAQLRTSQIQAGLIQEATLTRLADNIQNITVDKLANVAKDLSTARAIDLDKLRLLEEKPTSITETRDAPTLLRDIAGRLGIIDTTAQELQDNEHTHPTETTRTVGY